MRDLYAEAIEEGSKEWASYTGQLLPAGKPDVGPSVMDYWIARYAARTLATALLSEARKVGVTEDQWNALVKVAAEMAYD